MKAAAVGARRSVAAVKTFQVAGRQELKHRALPRNTATSTKKKGIPMLRTWIAANSGLAMTPGATMLITAWIIRGSMAALREASAAGTSGISAAVGPDAFGSAGSTSR